MNRVCSAHWTIGKSISARSDAVQIQGAQHLTGCKIYLPPIFLSLFCLSKAVILLSHLLWGLSYWDPQRTLHCLSFTSLPSASGTEHSSIFPPSCCPLIQDVIHHLTIWTLWKTTCMTSLKLRYIAFTVLPHPQHQPSQNKK